MTRERPVPRTVVITQQAMPYVPGDRPSLPDARADAFVRLRLARELTAVESQVATVAQPPAAPAAATPRRPGRV